MQQAALFDANPFDANPFDAHPFDAHLFDSASFEPIVFDAPPEHAGAPDAQQSLKTLLTGLFARPGYARHMMDMAAVMPSSTARQCYQVFMHTLLARRVAAGASDSAAPATTTADRGRALRSALDAAWSHPLVQRRWDRLASCLSPRDCSYLVSYARKRRLGPESL